MVSRVVHQPIVGVVVIEDAVDSRGEVLLHGFMDAWCAMKGRHITFLALEHSINYHIKKHSKRSNNEKEEAVTYVDAYSNPCGWREEKELKKWMVTNIDSLQEIEKVLRISVDDTQHSTHYLAIDSLSSLILRHGVQNVCTFLNALLKPASEKWYSGIAAVVHTDVHKDANNALLHLEYIANTIMKISTNPTTKHNLGTVSMTHKRVSGKVARVVEHFQVDTEGKLIFISNEKSSSKATTIPIPNQEDPTQNLTFNLKLSEQERIARESVVLPYVHQESEVASIMVEDDGDYDDEDPDADLDI